MNLNARVSVADPEIRQALTSIKDHVESAITVGATPGSTDDRSHGFQPGFLRIDSTLTAYVAMSVNTGAAQWKAIGTIGGGPITGATNGGAGGVGVFDSVSGSSLTFRNINVGSSKISVTLDAPNKEIDLDVVPGNIDVNALTGYPVTVPHGGTGLTSVTVNAVLKGNGSSALVASGVLIDASNFMTGVEKLTIDDATYRVVTDPSLSNAIYPFYLQTISGNILFGFDPLYGIDYTSTFNAQFSISANCSHASVTNAMELSVNSGKFLALDPGNLGNVKIGTTTGFLLRTAGVVSSVATIPATGIAFEDASVQIANRSFSGPPKDHIHHASAIVHGLVATARLGTGTADSTTFLRGDQTYAVVTSFDAIQNAVFASIPRAHRHWHYDLIGTNITVQAPLLLNGTDLSLNTVQVGYGGTGQLTLTTGAFLTGNATNAVNLVGPGTSGQIPISNGTAPVMRSISGDATLSSTGVLTITTTAFDPIANAVFSGPPRAHRHSSLDVYDFTESAQDAVGNALADSTTIDFTYPDASNQITAAAIVNADQFILANEVFGG